MKFLIADTFVKSLTALDVQSQSQVKLAAFDFQLNPKNPGFRFHKLDRAQDKNFSSFRVNKDIRIIVHRTEEHLILCYADHHDPAYAWAERRKLNTHPQTGAVQLVEVIEETVIKKIVKEVEEEAPLFAKHEPDYLLALGVPPEWLDAVRGVGWTGLGHVIEHLPQEASERLLDLADGKPVPRPVTPPVAHPFAHPDSQRRFRVIDRQEDLRRALESPWEQWLVFLHPTQREVVEKSFSGPARISGSAGTGKTVVALHRAAQLTHQNPKARILLTTYSKTLSARLSQNADLLLGAGTPERQRVEIVHLHRLAAEYYRSLTGQPFTPLNDEGLFNILDEAKRLTALQGFSTEFLKAEWDAIVDPNYIRDWSAYRSASRSGRGRSLGAKQKRAIWNVFECALIEISSQKLVTWNQLCNETAELLSKQDKPHYEHVIADECQDFGPSELKLLRSLVSPATNDLFFCGDSGQRLYRRRFSWLACGVDIRGRSTQLRINYRTTEEIERFSQKILPDTLEAPDGQEEARNTVSLLNGPEPEIKGCPGVNEEIESVAERLKALLAEGFQARDIAIFGRTEDVIQKRAKAVLERCGLKWHLLRDEEPPSTAEVSIGTMHRAKGLEFKVVLVMGCDAHLLPLGFVLKNLEDPADREAFLEQERNLLYVACTRARDHLLLSYAGSPSRFLPAETPEAPGEAPKRRKRKKRQKTTEKSLPAVATGVPAEKVVARDAPPGPVSEEERSLPPSAPEAAPQLTSTATQAETQTGEESPQLEKPRSDNLPPNGEMTTPTAQAAPVTPEKAAEGIELAIPSVEMSKVEPSEASDAQDCLPGAPAREAAENQTEPDSTAGHSENDEAPPLSVDSSAPLTANDSQPEGGKTGAPSNKSTEDAGSRARYRISPSTVARYFFQDCERFLRFSSVGREHRAKENIPTRQFDTSPLMDAIFDSGFRWEEEVIQTRLKGRVSIAGVRGELHTRRFAAQDTVALLRRLPPGQFIYQATLRVPQRFYQKHGVDSSLVRLSDNHPDLIAVLEGNEGRRRFRVMDVKRGDSLRYTHRIQILLYALELEAIIEEEGIDATVDLEQGAVWLGGQDAPTPCDLTGIRPHVTRFLRYDLQRVLSVPAEKAGWHVYYRCEWCEYFQHCWDEMKATQDLSQLAHLTSYGKRFLLQEAGVQNLTKLDDLLDRGQAADELLAGCASLAGRRHQLKAEVTALRKGEVQVHGASSPALPRFSSTELSLFLMLQQEPLGQSVYLTGLLASPTSQVPARLLIGADKPVPEIFIAVRPEQVAQVRRDFIGRLYEILKRVHDYNLLQDWKEKLSVQVYVHADQDLSLLTTMLLEALREPDLAERAMMLLFYFQAPDLILTDDHPGEPLPYPVLVLLNALGRLLALPVEVSYTLPETLQKLGSSFRYRRNEEYHFPLGHGLRSDAIHAAWYKGKAENIDDIKQRGRLHLYAVRALFQDLRNRVVDSLFAWGPKFALPETASIRDELLSRLAFFARYESMLSCLQLRAPRLESRDTQSLLGTVIELEALNDSEMLVCGGQPVELVEDDFPSWLLIRDSKEGREAQLQYPDYACRNKHWGGKGSPHRAVVGLASITEDELGYTRRLKVSYKKEFPGYKPAKGDRLLLYPRFTDYNTDRVVGFLQELDGKAPGLFLHLLRRSEQVFAESPLPESIEAVALNEEPLLGLTESQLAAYREIRRRRVMAVWGPPGTGKTHFLAAMILGLASAHARDGRSFRVLVTAFTHAAIENVLRKLSELQENFLFRPGGFRLGKAKHWEGEEHGELVKEEHFTQWLSGIGCSVIGATVYSCLKVREKLDDFDLVVIDEASQVRVPEASIPASLVGEGGRLVLAGDHLQLPPIVQGEYPAPPEGAPLLHRSIFEAALSTPGGEGKLVRQLLENFRMNDVLTSFAAGLLYGKEYRCFDDEVAFHRLSLTLSSSLSPLVSACLDPLYPMVLVILEGEKVSKESPLEADLVASLVVALREDLRDSEGNPYESDASFFHDGVFIVSPHHSQIRLIRRALNRERTWSARPFVDTVEKMQGQEAEVVIVSYGVSDPEYALSEASFIYGLNRLNVAITRARAKSIVFLSRQLLDATPQVLEKEEAARGLAFMRRLAESAEGCGEVLSFALGDGIQVRLIRTAQVL